MKHNRDRKPVLHRLRRGLSNLLWLSLAVYGVGTALPLVLQWLGATRWSPVELFDAFMPVALLPALIVVPVCLLRRQWALAATSMPAMMTFVIGYGVFFLPRPAHAESEAVALRFMTYNIHAESEQVQTMLDVIRAADADVVALQEVSPAMAEALAVRLSDVYPYQALHPRSDNPIFGQGVLSRYPIVDDEYWHISLGHQRVKLDVNGLSLVLYNTHPVHPFRIREGQLFDMQPHRDEVDEVLRRAADDTAPILIAGDFNMSDQADDYQRITRRFRDTYRETGWGLGWTFPDFGQGNALPINVPVLSKFVRPVTRIDFIFHSDDAQAIAARVWPSSGGSDHRPVVAEFQLNIR